MANCCAVRGSLTRDDTTIAIWSDSSAVAAPTGTTRTSVRRLAIDRATPASASQAIPAKYSTRPAAAIASVGSSAPSTLATSSSAVVTGVASNGSSVRACFSPMTACAASAIAPVTGMMRNSSRNCWNRNS